MKQTVITKAIANAIQRTPYRSTDGQGGNAKVIVKLFYPRGDNAFLVTEGGHSDGEKWDGDTVYGWCKHDGYEFEAGCFSLRELLETKAEIKWSFGTCYMGIERDTSVDVKKKTVLEVMGDTAPDFLKNPKPTEPEAVKAEPEAKIEKAEKKDGYTIVSAKPGEKPVVIAEVTRTEEVEPEETAKPEPEKKPVKAKRAKAAKVKAAKPDTLEDHPEPENVKSGEWDAENWKRMTDWNDHDGARVGIASWAANHATAERDEFALLLSDYLYVTAAGANGKDQELVDFRLELDEELKERVTRVYGKAKWAECAACL